MASQSAANSTPEYFCCAEIVDISINQLKKFISEGIPVIDVRMPYEWQETGIIKGSIPIMFYGEDGLPRRQDWLEQASSYTSTEKEVVLICRNGESSRMVAEYLIKEYGYTLIYNLNSGVKGWLASGNKTERFQASECV